MNDGLGLIADALQSASPTDADFNHWGISCGPRAQAGMVRSTTHSLPGQLAAGVAVKIPLSVAMQRRQTM